MRVCETAYVSCKALDVVIQFIRHGAKREVAGGEAGGHRIVAGHQRQQLEGEPGLTAEHHWAAAASGGAGGAPACRSRSMALSVATDTLFCDSRAGMGSCWRPAPSAPGLFVWQGKSLTPPVAPDRALGIDRAHGFPPAF